MVNEKNMRKIEKIAALYRNNSRAKKKKKQAHTAKFCASIIIGDVHLFVKRLLEIVASMMKNISIESDQIKLHLVHSF